MAVVTSRPLPANMAAQAACPGSLSGAAPWGRRAGPVARPHPAEQPPSRRERAREEARTAALACSFCAAEMTAAAALRAAAAAAAATSPKVRCGASRMRPCGSSSSASRGGGGECCRGARARDGAAPPAGAGGAGAARQPQSGAARCSSGALLRHGRSGGAARSCPEHSGSDVVDRQGWKKSPAPWSHASRRARRIGDTSPLSSGSTSWGRLPGGMQDMSSLAMKPSRQRPLRRRRGVCGSDRPLSRASATRQDRKPCAPHNMTAPELPRSARHITKQRGAATAGQVGFMHSGARPHLRLAGCPALPPQSRVWLPLPAQRPGRAAPAPTPWTRAPQTRSAAAWSCGARPAGPPAGPTPGCRPGCTRCAAPERQLKTPSAALHE